MRALLPVTALLWHFNRFADRVLIMTAAAIS